MGASIDGEEGGVADGAGRVTDERGGLPGVHGGSGVDVQPASIASTANIAVDVVHACQRGRCRRTPDSATRERVAFKERCLDACWIMGRPIFSLHKRANQPRAACGEVRTK